MSIATRFSNVVINREFLPGRRNNGFLWIILAMSASTSLCFATAAPKDDLLTSLIDHSEAAWEKIRSLETIQYTHKREWLARRRKQPYQGIAQIKKKGDRFWSSYRRTMLNLQSGQVSDREYRLVINEKYVAEWPDLDGPLAYQWDHNSVDSISLREKLRLSRKLPFDFLPHCFGNTRYRFQEAIALDGDSSKFDAAMVKGEDHRILYQITRKRSKTASNPDMVWIIDPQKGFLAIESKFYAGGEYLLRRCTMHIEEISPGVWYPVGYEERRFDELKAGQSSPNVVSWVKSVLTDMKINEPLPDTQFDVEALGFDEAKRDVRVVRTGIDGETTLHVYTNGKLVSP